MPRISREQMFMNMAEVAAQRSTCFRGNAGALIVKNNDIVSVGYNGPDHGEPHCTGSLCEINPETLGCLRSLHAERNAIIKAAEKIGDNLSGCVLFSTVFPCTKCLDEVIKYKIKALFFRYPYRVAYTSIAEEAGIKVLQVLPCGYVIRNGEIINA